MPPWEPVVISSAGDSKVLSQENVPDKQERWTTLAGTAALAGPSVVMTLDGSFGPHELQATGADLRIEISMSSTSARYEQIEFRTPFINQSFSGSFASGFGGPLMSVQLDTSFSVTVSTTRPSPDLSLMPSSDGGFRLDSFTTSSCNFSCYQIEVAGTWKLTEAGSTTTGMISSIVSERGVGADASASSIDPAGFPASTRLKGFSWSANSGGTPIPDLMNQTVGGIPIRLFTTHMSFPGVRSIDLKLNSDEAMK